MKNAKKDHCSKGRNLCSCEKKAWKNSGLPGFECWLLQYLAALKPIELGSQLGAGHYIGAVKQVYKFLILRSNVVLKYMLLVCLCIRSGIPPFSCARSALEKLRIKKENDVSEVNISWKMCLICYAASYRYMQGLYGVLNSRGSAEICPAIFQTWKKSGKWR